MLIVWEKFHRPTNGKHNLATVYMVVNDRGPL